MTPEQTALFEQYMDLAERIARKVFKKYPHLNGLDLNDYKQLGLIGLIDAVKKYRPSRGDFKPYAWRRITGHIQQGIRDADEVGRSRRAAGFVGPTVSLESVSPANDAERVTLMRDLLTVPDHGDQVAAYDEIRKLLSGLHRDARAVVYMHACEDMTLWQIACVLGVTESYVSQLRTAAMEYLAKCHARVKRPHATRRGQPSLFE